jgi:hypothetical protein
LLSIVLRTCPCLIHRAGIIIDPIISDQRIRTQANLYQPPTTTHIQTINNKEMGANVHATSSHVLVKVCSIHRATQLQVDIQSE